VALLQKMLPTDKWRSLLGGNIRGSLIDQPHLFYKKALEALEQGFLAKENWDTHHQFSIKTLLSNLAL